MQSDHLWWSQRCGVREGETPRGSARLAQLIKSYADEFSALKRPSQMADSVLPKAAWKRPPTDNVKLNCDGAFRQQNRSGGWGFVLRDHDGCILDWRRF